MALGLPGPGAGLVYPASLQLTDRGDFNPPVTKKAFIIPTEDILSKAKML